MEVKIIKKGEGEVIIEEGEISEIHANTDKIVFSIGTILPGQKASLDKGHKNADEVCYVAEGEIIISLPNIEKNYFLNKGDSILIPPGEPHYAINIGEKNAITVWACAPSL